MVQRSYWEKVEASGEEMGKEVTENEDLEKESKESGKKSKVEEQK